MPGFHTISTPMSDDPFILVGNSQEESDREIGIMTSRTMMFGGKLQEEEDQIRCLFSPFLRYTVY